MTTTATPTRLPAGGLWGGHLTDLVPCPQCRSTASRCRRPSGHDVAEWHLAREDAQADACGCDGCRAWLQRRAVAR